jgi:hypothetical protein
MTLTNREARTVRGGNTQLPIGLPTVSSNRRAAGQVPKFIEPFWRPDYIDASGRLRSYAPVTIERGPPCAAGSGIHAPLQGSKSLRLKCSGSFHRWSGGRGRRCGKGTQRGPGPTYPSRINGRIEVSVDLGRGALPGEPVKPFSILLM